MKVLVIGGGIAGLTTALCCIKLGLNVEVFEQSSEINEVGAGLQISPNGSRILYRLGLQTELEKVAFHPKSLDFRIGQSGRTVFSIPMQDAKTKYGAPYLHIHRADLIEVLLNAIKQVAPNAIYTNKRVVDFENTGSSASISFQDGSSHSGDVVIGADGIHSNTRQFLLGDESPRFTGNVAWRAIIPANKVPAGLIPPAATVWTGEKRHAVTYYLRCGELINFVGIVEQDNWKKESWNQLGNPSQLRDDFKGFCQPIYKLTQSIETCFKTALHDRFPLARWSDNRVAILGDAAHPMLPFLAQGAVMAIEDSDVIARLLDKNKKTPEKALQEFERIRKPRTSRVQASARANMNLFHHGSSFSKAINYGPIWLAARLAPHFINSKQDWLYLHDTENP